MSEIIVEECPVIALVRATVRARCEAAGVAYVEIERRANALADEEWPLEWSEGAERIEASDAEIQANQHVYCRSMLSLSAALAA